MRTANYRKALLPALCTLFLASCGQREDDRAAGAFEDPLLSYVPAHASYVFAGLEPMPQAYLAHIEPSLDQLLRAYATVLLQAARQAAADSGLAEESDTDSHALIAIAEEFSALMSIDGLRSAGIDLDSTGVFYGNGLLPVARLRIADTTRFEATLDRIEAAAGREMSRRELGTADIRFLSLDELLILLAAVEDQVVISVAPEQFDDAQLSSLLGLTPPATSIIESGQIKALAERYGYAPQFIGFVDIARLAETLTGSAEGLDADLLNPAATLLPLQELTDICVAEVRELAAIAPRLAFGYTEINEQVLRSHAILELRDDIAAGLATIPGAVPGLGADPGGLLAFGLAIDLLAARNFYEARLDALEADPFECDGLAPMMAGVAAGREALAQPLPPIVYDFRGVFAVIDRVEGIDLAKSAPPDVIDARLLFSVKNAPALIALGGMFSPEIAALNLEPGGLPMPLELPWLGGISGGVRVALTEDAIALSVGQGPDEKLRELLEAESPDSGALMSFTLDAGRYYAFISEAVKLAEEDNDDKMPVDVSGAMQEIMLSLSNLYDRLRASIRLTTRGLEIESENTMTLQGGTR